MKKKPLILDNIGIIREIKSNEYISGALAPIFELETFPDVVTTNNSEFSLYTVLITNDNTPIYEIIE